MKTVLIVFGTIALVLVLVVTGVWLGAAMAQGRGGFAALGRGSVGPWMMGGSRTQAPCGQAYGGSPMMGNRSGRTPCGPGNTNPGSGTALTLQDAQASVENYLSRLGYSGLRVTEVMEFDRNFYAIVVEQDSGIGAMELLVNKSTGAVGPEPGPNMMWNAKYGMHGRGGGMGMMGGYATGEMTLSRTEAEQIAQRWLDANLPGRTAGEADPFYGYYTLHYMKDGKIDGMLSVNGSTGDVWYHSWHGSFIDMIGEDEGTSS